MDISSQQPTPKRPYESPTISRVYVDPVVDMLTLCGDPFLSDGKTGPTVCAVVSS